MSDELLHVDSFSICFDTLDGTVKALNDLSLSIGRKEIVGLVGESGSGKTVLGLSIMGLIPTPPGRIVSGRILFQGTDITSLGQAGMENLRGTGISMIFQEPMTSLNPVYTVGNQIEESIKLRIQRNSEEKTASKESVRREVLEALRLVRIADPERVGKRYPHELSGGMRQRVMIAMALAAKPALIIADEPTTALDVTTQAQVLQLIRDLVEEVNASILIITHDFGVVAEIADRVDVMYAGRIVEERQVADIFEDPKHPYTQGLLHSLPYLKKAEQRLETIPGSVPSLIHIPSGCPFHPRCKYVMKECSEVEPASRNVENGKVACFLYGSDR
ncbi:MAG TPA: ABC transporter ATP-binding protein [Candidatus Bathyarchaeia archaeon]|nr:ABC transporter ATP-binding protein [Candidatus Bathyarchaeia archaeon]